MKDYRLSHAVLYEEPARVGFTVIDVLPFLVGRKWDEHALAFVHTIRPSAIRVTDGAEKSDAYCWRVTVSVDKDAIIQSIVQEVVVGLVAEWQHGADAKAWLRDSAALREGFIDWSKYFTGLNAVE